MTNEELKYLISELVGDEEELNQIIILEGDEFADGAIGLSEDNRVAHESIDSVEVNKDAIVTIRKVYYPTEKEVEEDGAAVKKLVNETFYKVSFMNGEAINLTKAEKNKLN